MLRDLRHALRSLKHSPGFSVVTVLTLAVGIGVTTAMFSIVDAVLLEPLAYEDPAGVMTVWESNPGIGVEQEQVSAGTFVDWRSRTRRFADLAAYQIDGYVLTSQDEPVQLAGATVTPSLFRVLGVPPVLGRAFTEEEGEPGGDRVAVLSHSFWQRRFGGQASVVGTVLTLDAQPYTVVGVMPPTFQFPPDENMDLWIPLSIPTQLIPVRGMRSLQRGRASRGQCRAHDGAG